MAGPSSAEEGAVKRNTDCVYFLASPLTCKKGSDCEYRHSDFARVNPRDCWFWLHGNCLNRKCGFRHPPLDGLLGTETPTSTCHSLTPAQNVYTYKSSSNAPNSSSRPAPCMFFQKGFCLKGDWCPFLHAPNSTSNEPSLLQATAAAAEPTKLINSFGGRENYILEKKVLPTRVANTDKFSHKAKLDVQMEPAPPPRNEFAPIKSISRTPDVNGMHGFSVTNGDPFSMSDRVQQYHLSGEHDDISNKDVGDVSRNPSPGFDVLVDDERRDSDYYSNDDPYGMAGEHEARNEYDIDPDFDYNLMPDIDSERFQGHLGYDLCDINEGQQTLERRRASSERIPGGGYLERRRYARFDSVDKVDELDLRHRLNMRKKSNSLRSIITREHSGDRQVEDGRYPGFHRNEQHDFLQENSFGNRLRGRICLPGRSSPIKKDTVSVVDCASVRTSSSSHQGRIRDRIKGRVREDFHNGGKKHQDMLLNEDTICHDSADFTGPKSLSELKNQKDAQPSTQHEAHEQSLGKRKHLMLDEFRRSGSYASFEGPMPLEEILKRKRGENIGIWSGKNSPDRDGSFADNNEKEGNGMVNTSDTKTVTPVRSNKDALNSVSVEKTKAEESRSAANAVSGLQPVSRMRIAEDDMHVVDEVGNDGESDHGKASGGNYNSLAGENGDADGQYPEEDDDDDFAKKMGVMHS